MANTITKQTIVNGPRNLVVKIVIEGEAAGSDESETVLIDVSTYGVDINLGQDVKIVGVHSALNGFTAMLLWDATANVPAVALPDYEFNWGQPDAGHSISYSGITNNAGSGKTGDILITTTGLGAAADYGHIILEMKKRG